MQNSSGAVVVPQLDRSGLQSLAKAGGGLSVRMTPDTTDLQQLAVVRDAVQIAADQELGDEKDLYWIERSPWLLWPLLMITLLLFRKGVLT